MTRARRLERLLIAGVLLGAAAPTAAQNRSPSPARDTMAPELILSEVFTSAQTALAPRVALSEGVVYRVEIQPGSATITIRSARRPSLPPLLMVPLSREALESGSAAGLVVPRSTEEYRIDVAVLGEEPVRVRIWRDPQESARWTRIRAEGIRFPVLAAAVRAVYLTSFRDAYASPLDSVLGYHIAPQSAYGVEGCLAVVPNGRILPDRVGGCAVTLAFWFRGAGRSFYTVGVAPEVMVLRTGAGGVSVSPQLAFGSSRGGRPTAQYVLVGVGARYAVPLQAPQTGIELEAAVVNVRSQPASPDPRRVSTVTLRLGAGLRMSL